jgi:hypothetical protein
MSSLSKLLAASVLALSFAVPALANDHNYAPSLNNGNLFYVGAGKFYAAEDTMMGSGKMLSAELFDRKAMNSRSH